MILLSRAQLKEIVDAAESAYPSECCGLLVGRVLPAQGVAVTRVAKSPNLAPHDAGGKLPSDRFEVDPELRLRLQLELEGTGERIVGHYHSHPDHPAQPSQRDLDSAFEPELVWLIVAVEKGQAVHATAHVLDHSGRQFREIPLREADSGPYPLRPPVGPR